MVDAPSNQPADASLTAQLHELAERISTYRASTDELTGDLLLSELETAHEELRVAEEEVRIQQEELDRLVRNHKLVRTARERFAARLPVPMVFTDDQGMILFANSAVGALLSMPHPRLRGKPLLSYIDTADRPEIRRYLSRVSLTGSQESFNSAVTLSPRSGDPVTVELAATIRSEEGEKVEVMWAMVGAHRSRSALRSDTDLARVLSKVARVPLNVTPVELLNQVVRACQEAFAVPIAVSVTVGHPGSPDVLASDSALAQHIDGAQDVAGEGPCASAFETQQLVVTTDLSKDERWPRLAARLGDEEPLAVVAVPLEASGGALNFYIDAAAGADLSAVAEAAELIATTLSATLHEAEIRTELETVAAQLQTAMQSRATIDQAKGIIMARQGCSADEAFQVLVRASSRTNIRLRELAYRLVEQTEAGGGSLGGTHPFVPSADG